MGVDRSLFHYSVTILTHRAEVLAALRGLSFKAQETESKYVLWGGTGEKDWQKHHHQVRFFFSDSEYRSNFLKWATELLPPGSWQNVGDSDELPMPERD